jgi:hypothetical protein
LMFTCNHSLMNFKNYGNPTFWHGISPKHLMISLFTLRAMVLWTINNFLGYGMLLGCAY